MSICALPAILYDNAARDAGVSPVYSGSIVSGFEPINASDWRDFSLFRAASGTSTLDYAMAQDRAIDSACIYLATICAGTITLQYESSPAVYTTLATWNNASVGVHMQQLASVTVLAGRNVRWLFSLTGLTDIRQLAAGPALIIPIGQRSGLNPPTLTQGIVVNNTIATNGSIIGRSIRRMDRKTQLSVEYITPEYVRTTWESFAQHAVTKAFFYSWDYQTYPDEVTMSIAESIGAPENMPNPRFMKVDWPLRHLV